MKSILTVLILTTLAAARAQEAPEPPPVPPAPPPHGRIPMPHELIHDAVQHAFGVAQRAVSGAAGVAGRAVPGAPGPGADVAAFDQQSANRAVATVATSSRGSRTLVIHSSEPDPAATSNIEEDLAIMARILDKAARNSPDDGRHNVLGIAVDGSVFGSASGARNIFLEGYGALFLIGVKFPLIAPPEKPEPARAKDTSSDDWKRARDEIQGGVHGGTDLQFEPWSSATPRGSVEEFDADKVEKLKDSLLESLKNATHIRALKPDEYISIVVQGGDVARGDVKRVRSGNNDKAESNRGNYTVARKTTGAGQSVMTIRVKKSDADAFAQGKLTPAEFRKKAAIQTYLRKSDGAAAANYFMQTVR